MAETQTGACSNKHPCSCPDNYCPRHGRCCDCVAYHKEKGNLPMCLRGLEKSSFSK